MENAEQLPEGPWEHKNFSAGGASFHVAISGNGPHTVILLHDFPLNWWTWRSALPALADAGYRAIAMDLRGFGHSDLQPGDVDLNMLASDVTSVLGVAAAEEYTVVGAGMGGTIAWLLAHQKPFGIKSLVTVSSPHPLAKSHLTLSARAPHPKAAKIDRLVSLPGARRRALQDGRLVRELLLGWSSPESLAEIDPVIDYYSGSMQRRFAASSAWETYCATDHIPLSERHLFESPVEMPVCSIRGGQDPRVPARAFAADAEFVAGNNDDDHHGGGKCGLTALEVESSGHYISEEEPAVLNRILIQHLKGLG